MKRLVTLILTVFMLFALSACSGFLDLGSSSIIDTANKPESTISDISSEKQSSTESKESSTSSKVKSEKQSSNESKKNSTSSKIKSEKQSSTNSKENSTSSKVKSEKQSSTNSKENSTSSKVKSEKQSSTNSKESSTSSNVTSENQSSTKSKESSTSSNTSSKNQGPTIIQTDTYYAYFSNKEYPYGQREEWLSVLECGTAVRMVYYRGWGQNPPKNTTIKVGAEHTFSLWTYPHHHFCGGYEYIIEDGSVLKIASSDLDGMYDEPIPKVLFKQCTVVGVKPGKTTLTYKVTSAEGTESVTLNITVVE